MHLFHSRVLVGALQMRTFTSFLCTAAQASPIVSSITKRSTHRGVLSEGHHPTEEQLHVADCAERGLNILCRAVAGAGKTTTLLLCAERAPTKQHLLLTYSKHLQLEVSNRAPSNVAALTYHAAAGTLYGAPVKDDTTLRSFLMDSSKVPKPPLHKRLCFDVLCLDETQDMTVEYFALVRELLTANPSARMIVVGDELQSINEFRGAHPGFLTDACTLFSAFSSHQWESCRLSISQRLTPATAAFVNVHLYNDQKVIFGGNTRCANRLPIYCAVSPAKPSDIASELNKVMREMIAEFGVDNVLVLAASVRGLVPAGSMFKKQNSYSPLAILIRDHLTDIPVHINPDRAGDESLNRGKVVVRTFNGSKGCERDCVILVSFDESFFQFYDRKWDDCDRLPNVLPVAATRAKKQLVVVASWNKTLRTVMPVRFPGMVDFRSASPDTRPASGGPVNPCGLAQEDREHVSRKGVVDLVRHLHPETKREAMSLITTHATRVFDKHPHTRPKFETKVHFAQASSDHLLTEDVSFLYGETPMVLAEVAMNKQSNFDSRYSRAMSATTDDGFTWQSHFCSQLPTAPPDFVKRLSDALAKNCIARTPTEWVIIIVAQRAVEYGYHHLPRQIKHFDWVNEEALIACRDIVTGDLKGMTGEFEVDVPQGDMAQAMVGRTFINGRADFVQKAKDKYGHARDVIWEYKLNEICEEDELQLACYVALNGGGRGILRSILRRYERRIYVSPGNAKQFLEVLANSSPDGLSSVIEVIADFDDEVLKRQQRCT